MSDSLLLPYREAVHKVSSPVLLLQDGGHCDFVSICVESGKDDIRDMEIHRLVALLASLRFHEA